MPEDFIKEKFKAGKENPVVSVIIPCYNSGRFLGETVESIKNCKDIGEIEVIIVDDGSTDKITLNLLETLKSEDYIILYQENKGPAAARNTGVKISKSDYLFFLDSDNKIRENYIKKGISVLHSNPAVGIVYGKPAFFGDSTAPRFETREYNKHDLFFYNYIDMCSLMRKQVWEEAGEFDESEIVIGYEDWEFWIRCGATKWKFYFLNETCFDYRIRNNSLVTSAETLKKTQQMRRYVLSKDVNIVLNNYHALYSLYNNETKNPMRTFVKNILRTNPKLMMMVKKLRK